MTGAHVGPGVHPCLSPDKDVSFLDFIHQPLRKFVILVLLFWTISETFSRKKSSVDGCAWCLKKKTAATNQANHKTID